MSKSAKRIVHQWQHDPEKMQEELDKLDSRKGNVVKIDARRMQKLQPKTQAQSEFINSIKTKDQVVAMGPAGTGKTFVSAGLAVEMFMEEKVKRIILTRPNVSASKSLGFFPGSIEEKFGSWTIPFTEIMKERLGNSYYDYCVNKGKIESVPFETMRGRSFDDAFVIVDEAQSTTVEEMQCLVTRIGRGSKLVMIGDVKQKDINKHSGLEWVIDKWHSNEKVKQFVDLIEFDIDDVVRSDVCGMWVKVIWS